MCEMPAKLPSPTSNLSRLRRQPLAQLIAATAPSRIDHKFCVPTTLLEPLLALFFEHNFSVIEFESKNISSFYETHYFDDKNLQSFQDHRCGKFFRQKFRWRKYGETGDEFLEKKEKTKGLKTKKERFTPIKNKNFATQLQSKFNTAPLSKSLTVVYERHAFLSADLQTKITIDQDLTIDDKKIMPDFFILEIKTPKISANGFSVIKKFLHSHRVRKISFSKYCVGMCHKHPNLPKNKWKQIFKKYIKPLA